MKKVICLIVTAVMALSVCGLFTACGKTADFTVGICQLTRHDALDSATQGFKDALEEELKKAGKTVKFDLQNAQGDSGTCSVIVNKFVSAKVDLIMANATPALQASANATETIPVLGTSVTDYGDALNIKNFTGTVGGNVSGTSDLAPLDQQADMIAELIPSAKKIGLLYCAAEANSLFQVNKIKEYLEAKSITAEKYGFTDSNDISAVVTRAVSECDALYIPTDNTAASNTGVIDSICRPKKIPVVCGEEGTCKGCGIATLSISYYNLGVETGKMASEILLGQAKISETAIAYDTAPQYKYNKEICDELGITVPEKYVAIEIK